MEIGWNINENAWTSLVLSTNHLPISLENCKAVLLIGPWESTAIETNSPCDESLTSLIDAANSAAASASRDEASRYESAVVQDTVTSHIREVFAHHETHMGVFPQWVSRV